jgi:hypothetical protein
MDRKKGLAVMASIMLASMVGVAPPADAKAKTLRARVHSLEKSNRQLRSIVADQDATLNEVMGMLSCFGVVSVGTTLLTDAAQPDPANPFQVIAVDPSQTSGAWIATVDDACVGPAAAATRGRALHRAFAPRSLR